jgi:hypothetical protein
VGKVTAAGDPEYNATFDPANWRPCDTCDGSDPVAALRRRRSERPPHRHRPHPVLGLAAACRDIVALSRPLDPALRFPPRRSLVAGVDRAGLVWRKNDLAC